MTKSSAIFWLTLCGVVHPASADIRYECHMMNDSVRLTVANLANDFPQAVSRCLAVQVILPPSDPSPDAEDEDGDPEPPPPMVEIVAPLKWPVRSVPRSPSGFPTLVGGLAMQASIANASRRHGLDPRLIDALIHVESRHQTNARSPKGALGLMQIMPGTAQRYGVMEQRHLLNPDVNLDVGIRYLKDLLRRFNGRLDLALAAYNSGEGNVLKYGSRVPPFPETQAYVRNIMRGYIGRGS